MNLIELLDKIPDWVHLHYAYAQIVSDENFAYVAKVPSFFFARLEQVVTDEGKQKRNEIFVYFVKKLVETRTYSDEISNLIKEKAAAYGVEREIDNAIAPVPDYESMLETYEARLSDKDKKIKELLLEIQELKVKKALESKSEIEKLSKENAELKNSNNLLETKIVDLQNGIANLTKQLESALNNRDDNFENAQELVGSSVFEKNNSGEYRTDGHVLLTKNQRNQKILVIGAGTNKDTLSLIVKKRGFEKNDVEFILDYDKITNITRKMNFGNYAAIICGPMPHSASGIGDDSSLITALENNEYCSVVVRATKTNGALSLNDSAFKRAINSVMERLSILN